MNRPHRFHPVGTTRSPQRCRKYSGATDRPYNLIEEVKHFSCLLYLAVRVGEGRQLILVKTEKSGEKEKRFSIFFLVEQYETRKMFRIEF